eukprot:TRINITY_DN870_c0_g2_i1.p1 TRINITY_DN870_c0_g2~~TRINITY_DN870_c0_g2_i1.p1  ORF type:complete len:344 (-),score=118.05 TRINITY_DN870_c0_g2_i1:59-1090(-)
MTNTIEGEEITIKGQLFKKSPDSRWQKRYCYATHNKFIYYKKKVSDEEDYPQGTISLSLFACSIPPADDIAIGKQKHCFVLKSLNKEFYFSCESAKEQQKWVGTLQGASKEILSLGFSASSHTFKKVHFTKTTFCPHCETFVWALAQGYMCKVCNVCVHKKCIFKYGDNCSLQESTTTITTITSSSPPSTNPNSSPSSSSNRKGRPSAAPTGTITGSLTIGTSASTLHLNSSSAPPSPTSSSSSTSTSSASSLFGGSTRRTATPSKAAPGKSSDDLKKLLEEIETKESAEITEASRKYEEQIAEIYDEIVARQMQEIFAVEEKYDNQKKSILEEIQFRTSAQA